MPDIGNRNREKNNITLKKFNFWTRALNEWKAYLSSSGDIKNKNAWEGEKMEKR